jgi:outer membrane protein, heavy metal efflux system
VVVWVGLGVALVREQVLRLFGVHGTQTNWTIEHQLAPVPRAAEVPPELEREALKANLGMLETRQRLEGLARRAGATSLEGWLPDVSVDVHGLKGDPDATANQQWQVGGGVSVGVPLFDRRQGLVVELRAEFDVLMERYYGMAVALRSGAREIRARVSSSHARATHYQHVILPAQRKVLEQTMLQYNAMQLGVFQLLDARAELLELELSYIETLREYWSAVAELDALLAGQLVASRPDAASATIQNQSQTSGGH